MTLRIDVSHTPTDEERLGILIPLRAYNVANAGPGNSSDFALLIRDEHDAILGGLYGKLFYRWMFVELLSVPDQARGQGMGTRLMQMAEALAEEKQCIGIYLDTFDFQAPAFYKKLGFTEIGQIADYPPGHSRFFFQKRLRDAD